MPPEPTAIDPELTDFAVEAGLARPGESMVWTPLAGGVSSDIWRLNAGGRTVCVKRALEKLRVVADWQAPASRSLVTTAARTPTRKAKSRRRRLGGDS